MLDGIVSRLKMIVLFSLFFLPVIAEWYAKKVDDYWREITAPIPTSPQEQGMADRQ